MRRTTMASTQKLSRSITALALTGAAVSGLVVGMAGPAAAITPPGVIYSKLMFCGTDVLGLLDLDCKTPPKAASEYPTADAARADAARMGKSAKWCAIPVAGQSVVCTDV